MQVIIKTDLCLNYYKIKLTQVVTKLDFYAVY